ncbi:MAG: DAK2 domain-containing protein [Oscillospiraceae bacterium]|nr:DAK2 domain-containing protein [Oscillospiraceae bacterium]
MISQVTGQMLKQMLINASANIENHKQELNDLNVFPVPDGDTGTNMSLTIGAGEKALESLNPQSVGEAAEASAKALLRGARGNSGVILSLLFRGFSKRLKDLDTCDATSFALAMATGVDSAYKAVMKPAEGTMLTVSRVSAGSAVSAAESTEDIEAVLEQAIEAGRTALAETMYQNPVLEKAGVIDAGGKGYIYMLEGMLKGLRGEVVEKLETDESSRSGDKADFAQFAEEDITFTYCTEFMIEVQSDKDVALLKTFLDARGDSVVVVDDDSVIKVHVHTDEPGNALTEGLTYGQLISIKIENMREQLAEAAGASGPGNSAGEPEEMKDFAIVTVCVGAGIESVFSDLGADRIITGGQTMNPSTQDILEQINSAPSEVVFVLPNNKNIIMAAQQCVNLTEKSVVVVPTRSIPQGVSAMLSLGVENDVEGMGDTMAKAAKLVRTALVTKAARDSVFDDMEIKKDEYLALVEDHLTANSESEAEVFDAVAKKLGEREMEFVTIFTGEDAVESETEVLAAKLKEAAPEAEVAVIFGGQPVYQYIISAE